MLKENYNKIMDRLVEFAKTFAPLNDQSTEAQNKAIVDVGLSIGLIVGFVVVSFG